MTELKEAIKPALPGKKKQHPEAEIKILEIKDAEGRSMIGGEVDLRRFAVKGGKTSTMKLELKKQPSIVSVTIEPEPGSKVAKKYYGETPAWTYLDSLGAGQHTIEWDGRSDIEGSRFLIEGTYKVTAWCACICGNEYIDVKTIKVKKPYGDAYGHIYPAAHYPHSPAERDFTTRATHVRDKLKSLSDGSGFECVSGVLASASDALKRMCDYSAVWYWNGHAGPGILAFYTTPTATMTAVLADNSVAATYGVAAANAAVVDTLPDGALNDVFLAVLFGCETAKAPSVAQAMMSKGADIVVAFTEKVPIRLMSPWTTAFVAALDGGESVEKAGDTAVRGAALADRPTLKHDVVAGGGASKADKLLPARCGRKK